MLFGHRLLLQGAAAGGILGLVISSWLILSSLQLNIRQPTLPPTSTDGCAVAYPTVTYNLSASPWLGNGSDGVSNFPRNSTTSSLDFYTKSDNATTFRSPTFTDARPVNVILLR
jgi:hypothetical protein